MENVLYLYLWLLWNLKYPISRRLLTLFRVVVTIYEWI